MRGEDDDAFRARMEAKGAHNRYFRSLWAAAEEAARRKPQVTIAPKRVRKAKAKPAGRAPLGPLLCPGGCGRISRPHHTTLKEYPDTVRRGLGELCNACTEGRKRVARSTCVECGIQMVTGRHNGQVPEGKRRHVAHGKCSTCYHSNWNERRNAERAANRAPRPTHCRECGVELVLARGVVVPQGRKRHMGHGLCTTCYPRARRAAA